MGAAESAEVGAKVVPANVVAVVTTDEAIEQAIREGEHRRALTLCARHHARAVGQLCMALLGAQAEAEDVVQETLLDAHAAFGSFRGEGSVRAWLCGIARRKCARQIEQRVRRTARLRLVVDAPAPSGGEDALLGRERANRAREALEGVRPTEREALVLRYSAELSFREIAAACGIDEPAARKRVSRALGKIRQVLSESEEE